MLYFFLAKSVWGRAGSAVEMTRLSLKNAQYEKVVKQGDVLLNDVQRLSKVLY